jgi:chain length determinant protein (polysaccharide antigen chain regulator)
MFLLGSEYLKGEIENLQKRASDDAFIQELPALFNRLEELNSMTFDFAGIKPYRIDKVAEADGKAEKPKRALIVVVGTVLSGFIAIFVALIMGAVKRRRELRL